MLQIVLRNLMKVFLPPQLDLVKWQATLYTWDFGGIGKATAVKLVICMEKSPWRMGFTIEYLGFRGPLRCWESWDADTNFLYTRLWMGTNDITFKYILFDDSLRTTLLL